MNFSLKTPICWNISIVMLLAICLISFVVFQITEQKILQEHINGAEKTFSAINTAFSQVVRNSPELLTTITPYSRFQKMVNAFSEKNVCKQIILCNKDNVIVAHTTREKIGEKLSDVDLIQSIASKTVYKQVQTSNHGDSNFLVIASPLYVDKKLAGGLKTVFSLHDVQKKIIESKKIVLLYIVVDALVLILLGTFLLSRYLVKPLNKLIKLTENISEGNFDSPYNLSDRNEIRKLSSSLTRMLEKIREEKKKEKDYIKSLQDKNVQLQMAQQEIIHSEKLASIGRLAAGIAHEIGNPIGIVLGYLHMASQKNIDDKQRMEYIRIIEQETEKINTIIKDLLDYSRPSLQEKEVLSLNDTIEEACSLVSYQKGFQNIHVIIELAPELPSIYANGREMQQVFINLLFNALDAMPHGGTITVRTGIQKENGEEKIYCSISDTGIGINIENQKKIFDPFFTTKPPGRGTGLGLSNVYRIVKTLEGKITVESSPGKGTTFTLILPVKKPCYNETSYHEPNSFSIPS